MADDKLTSMLERATADPPAGYAAALLDNAEAFAAASTTDLASGPATLPSADEAEPYVLVEQPRRLRRWRPFFVGAAAAAVVAVVGAAAVTLGSADNVIPVANADGLAIVVDGQPVPVEDLDIAAQRVAARADRHGLGDDERPLHTAANLLFERFLAELSRAEGQPVTDEEIDDVILDADRIEILGSPDPVDPADALADPDIRASTRHGIEVRRGMAVLRERFGVPHENQDAEALWRGWFAEQLNSHGATVSVDGQHVPNEELAATLLLFQPA